MKFRKKPVVVDIELWDKTFGELVTQFDYQHFDSVTCEKCHCLMAEHGWIKTLEGGHIVCPGDSIITGVKGEHYPIKPDILALTYEPESTPTSDLLTDEEIVAKEKEWESRFKDYKLEKGVKAEGFYSFIAQAQLSKLAARPTEQARENVWHILKNDKCKECLKSAQLFNPDLECQKCKRDQILRLLPDEQAIEKRTRKAIGEWLKKNAVLPKPNGIGKSYYYEIPRYKFQDALASLLSGKQPEQGGKG